MTSTPLTVFLVIFSGVCWTIVYLDGIRLGFKQKTYAIPFWALALNLAWEYLHSVLGLQAEELDTQTAINVVWLLCDLGILYTYLRFGRKYVSSALHARFFVPWSILVLVVALVLQWSFVQEFPGMAGTGYAAFLQNLLMSVLFIDMFFQRKGGEGQSLLIAVSKWLGTLAPTVLYGILAAAGGGEWGVLILVVGILCSVFDLLYIGLLVRLKVRERRGGGQRAVSQGQAAQG